MLCKHCYDYESAYGIDLLHDCITGLSEKIAKMMDINPRIKRMDSMIIAANIRKLSRAELLYICVAKMALYLYKNNQDALPEGFGHIVTQTITTERFTIIMVRKWTTD